MALFPESGESLAIVEGHGIPAWPVVDSHWKAGVFLFSRPLPDWLLISVPLRLCVETYLIQKLAHTVLELGDVEPG